MSQLEASFTDSNELILVESRTMRDQHVYRDSVLEKVKVLPLLGSSVEVTTEMAATYYEVSPETIRTIIKRHRDEFNDYEEMRVLKGKALNDFCEVHDELRKIISAKSRSITVINRRGLLRLGMLLTESEVAKSVRNYLLNVEEVSDNAQRMWAVEREISKRERRQLTDAIQEFYQGTLKNRGMEYSTFTNLVYKVLFDATAKQLREEYELGKNEPIRDAFTTEDLRKIVKVERAISVLIELGHEYRDIRDILLAKKEQYQ